LSSRAVRLPDVAFISHKKFRGKLPLEPVPEIAPDLAVEVLSESNTRREIDRKIGEYFAAGTELVWIIDPATRSAVTYTAPDQSQPIPPEGVLDGANVLPGFQLSLAEVFRIVDENLNGPVQTS
jgi:Uma2 family endonuclease